MLKNFISTYVNFFLGSIISSSITVSIINWTLACATF